MSNNRNNRVVSIAIGHRDFQRLRKWAQSQDMTPEQLLARIIGDERVRRKRIGGVTG